jgi:hypothetical protein
VKAEKAHFRKREIMNTIEQTEKLSTAVIEQQEKPTDELTTVELDEVAGGAVRRKPY